MLRRWQRERRVAGSCDPRVNPSCDDSRVLPDDGGLRLLRGNIPVGIC
ncbi:EEP domain-containing protein, partial [Pseudomonas aeruginosa]